MVGRLIFRLTACFGTPDVRQVAVKRSAAEVKVVQRAEILVCT